MPWLIKPLSSAAVYDIVLEQAEQLLPPLMFNLLLLSLSLHTYSPTVAMFQQVSSLWCNTGATYVHQ